MKRPRGQRTVRNAPVEAVDNDKLSPIELTDRDMEAATGGIMWAFVIVNAAYFVLGTPYARDAS